MVLAALRGIELPGEKAGNVASREYKKNAFTQAQDKIWYPAETLDAAIGQGYNSFTPIQIANYIAAIANEGTWMKPHLIKSIVDPAGAVILEKNPEIGGQLDISRATHDVLKRGMLELLLLAAQHIGFQIFLYGRGKRVALPSGM